MEKLNMSGEDIKTILLVEDEAIIAIVVSKALKKFGYNVLNASSGERSVELTFSDKKIDLILMDIDLGGGIDGTEAARQILAKRNIPIVFHTSHSEREMVDRVRNITRYGYVVKSSGDFVLQSSLEMAFDLFNSHENARKESLRIQTILRTIPDMMFVVNGEGLFKDFSESSDSKSLAIPPEEIIGNNISALFSPDEVETLLALFRKCLDTGDVQNYIYTLEINNEQHTYDLRIAKLDDDEVLAIVRDITESKHAEMEIKNKTEELECANEELNAAIEEMEAVNEDLMELNEELLIKDQNLVQDKTFIEALLESVPGYLYVYDDQGKLIRWNKKHETMTGYSAEELSHMNMSDWFEGEDAVRVAIAVDEVLKTGYGEVEANLLTKGGKKLLIRSNGVRLIIDGKTYFTGVGMDITKSKETEIDLRRAEELYKKAQSMGHVGNWEYNLQTADFWGSDEAKRIYGFDPEKSDFLTDEVENCITERERVHQALIDLIEKGKEYNLEFEIHPKNSHEPKITWSIAELNRDENGEPLTVAGVIQDITDRKKMDEIFRETRDYLDNLLNYANAPIIVWDNMFRITKFNKAFERLSGRTEAEVLGSEVGILFPAETKDRSIQYIKNASGGDRLDTVEIEIQHIDGSISTLLWNSAAIYSSDGKTVVSTIAQGHDITIRKLAQEKISDLLQEKEIILQEVHHRVKNNMNIITGLLRMQADGHENPDIKNVLFDAESRVMSMMVLYDKLYRSDDFQDISIKSYISSLADEILSNFPWGKSVKIIKKLDDFVLDVRRLQPLGIIINELLTNVMKYAFINRDDGLITISAELAGNNAVIIIQDNGVGIPESVTFENSTGFGMQLVGMLTGQIGGTIKIVRGEGTKFVIEFVV